MLRCFALIAWLQPMKFLEEKVSGGKFDLIINLPMRNKYRRPASYMTAGSLTRRMAVDLGGLATSMLHVIWLTPGANAVPLITDIKCAKLFVEALRVVPRGPIVSDVDSQVPGLMSLNFEHAVAVVVEHGAAAGPDGRVCAAHGRLAGARNSGGCGWICRRPGPVRGFRLGLAATCAIERSALPRASHSRPAHPSTTSPCSATRPPTSQPSSKAAQRRFSSILR